MKKVRLVIVSDTHGRFRDPRFPAIPEGDILIHCGDMTARSELHEYYEVNRFFQQQKGFKHKIYIAGNHDRPFETQRRAAQDLIHGPIYLQDQFVEVMGLKIYGSPWQPEFCNWAFNLPREGEKLRMVWDMIPDDTDVLVTHCPPYGVLDTIAPGKPHLGCPLLAKRVLELNLKVHCFGHIHGGVGAEERGKTIYANAAICNEQYEPLNMPTVIDVVPNKKKGN